MIFNIYDDYVVANNVLISYTGNEKKICVPATIAGEKIHRIGDGAFYGSSFVEEIIVEDGIAEIGRKAFGKCPRLCYVQLPESIDEIAEDAFCLSELNIIDFYIKVPYLRYLSVKEGSIKLSDGRYLFDPMNMGAYIGNLIKGFMPGYVNNKFRVERNMGYLLAENGNERNSRIEIEKLLFDEFCSECNINVPSIMNTQALFMNQIRCGKCGAWFEHSEEEDDFGELMRRNEINTISALLFFVKEGHIGDDYIKLNFNLKKSNYFFQRGTKIVMDGKDYYLCQREYLTGSNKSPYVRDNMVYGVYCDDEGIRQAVLEEADNVRSKYKFLNELI